jgi:hypothetical protein
MTDSNHGGERPLERQVPPPVVATPGEVRAAGEMAWWTPGWRDGLALLGWRWILLAPAVLFLGAMAGAWYFQRWRLMLLALGGKLLVFLAAVAASLAAWGIRRAARARHEPFCIHCGYCLIGLPDNYRCPECGRPYNWRLIEEYRRDPAWFIERWKLYGDLPPADIPFIAGRGGRGADDGTE